MIILKTLFDPLNLCISSVVVLLDHILLYFVLTVAVLLSVSAARQHAAVGRRSV